MKLFDTHCHFETESEPEIRSVLERAQAAGVRRLIAVGGSPELNAAALAAKRAANGTSCAVDLALGFDREQIGRDLPSIPADAPLVAWGEIGIDCHYSPETRREQREFFAAQLEEARRRNLPVVIHTREADDDTLGVLREVPSRGVIHCFTGTPEFAKKLLDLGFFVSISGIVTFRAADNVRASALVVPDDRILVETDSPFLAPVPMRGKPNEPAFVAHTCRFLAELRGVDPNAFAELSFANALRCFGLDNAEA